MHPVVREAVTRYLRLADHAAPGRIDGFYVVGSTALAGFRPGRSDIDFVAVLRDDAPDPDLRRLRRAHYRMYARQLALAVRPASVAWPAGVNGVFVRYADLAMPPSKVVPIASQVAATFTAGRGFDVNPVTWRTLARSGIAVRGPHRRLLHVHDDTDDLREFSRGNLRTYWRGWAARIVRPGPVAVRARLRHLAASGVLGAPRLHYTIATGEVASKEAAGQYALETFGSQWRPIIREALDYWRGRPPAGPYRSSRWRRAEAAAFVSAVVESVG